MNLIPPTRRTLMIVVTAVAAISAATGAARATPAETEASSTPSAATPAAGSWRTIAESPLSARAGSVSVWTGRELLVWSGLPAFADGCSPDEGGGPICGSPAVFDGAAYDPATDTWR